MNKPELINAIVLAGFKSHDQARVYSRLGLAVFTGTQTTQDWGWNAVALNRLKESELERIYKRVKRP